MPDYAALAARYAGRPLLLTPQAARELALRIRTVDPKAFQRPGRLEAFLRKAGLALPRIGAMEDDDAPPPVPIDDALAYQPRWLGEVEDTGFCWSLSQGVALIQCDSPLVERGDEFCGVVWHGYDTLLQAIREAAADARVRGIFFREDTPGGVVGSGLPTLAKYMRSIREAAGGKPIWVYADMACSAGYWIGAQADRIIAPSVGYVGSIGAVMVHESYAGMLEQDGVEITTIEFPEGGVKTDGAWWKALSESARAAWQADVNQVGALFFADVTAGRPQLTEEAMAAMRADAFMGDHSDPERSGLALGLVDEIMDEEEAFAALVEHVSEPASGSPKADAQGSRASAPTSKPKEAAMAKTPQAAGKTAQVIAAEKALKLAQARLTKLKASASAEDAPEEEEEEEETSATETPSADEDETPAAEDDEDDDGADAAAIAASAEAKANPELALAAIRTGQSLAQFKANVSAQAGKPKVSRLDQAMQGSRRLGPDAGKAKAGLGGAVAARIAKNRGEPVQA